RNRPGRVELLLSAGRHSRDLWPAVRAEAPESRSIAFLHRQHLHGDPDRPGRAVRFPRANPARGADNGAHESARPRRETGGALMNPFVADPEWGMWIILYF